MDRPEITYPRPWTYRIVGTDEQRIRALVVDTVGGRSYALDSTRESAHGNYVAMRLEIEVRDEAERNAIFAALKESDAVRFVL